VAGPHQTDVLVVGAGPTGLVAALSLAEAGLSVEVIDEEWRPAGHSYALALHPRSIGVLAERLAKKGIKVRWSHRLAGLEPRGDTVTATVQRLEKESGGYAVAHTEWSVGEILSFRAGFVIGADGHRSLVRRALGTSFEETRPSQAFAIFECTGLAARIKRIRDGQAGLDLLDAYGRERLADWAFLLGQRGGLRPGTSASEFVAENAARLLPCLPATGAGLPPLAAQLGLEVDRG